MERRIIEIDRDKCNGCGACASACHEGAIGMKDGKAILLRDDYCDGLGDCLPACPVDAIHFVVREALAYDEAAVLKNKAEKENECMSSGCKGTAPQMIRVSALSPMSAAPSVSALRQWPVQIKLSPLQAPYFNGADLLIAADCSAYAYAGFHQEFIQGRTCLIGCPKLDQVDYSVKLTEILKQNDIRSVMIVKMEVPCCNGLEKAVKLALRHCGKAIPMQSVTISIRGEKI